MPDHSPKGPRPLGVRDAMVFVAATAFGIAWARLGWATTIHYQVVASTPGGGGSFGRAWPWLVRTPHVLLGGTSCLAVWTVALFGYQVRAVWPVWRLLLARPGPAACSAVVLALAWSWVGALTDALPYAGRGGGWSALTGGLGPLSGFRSWVTLTSAPCGFGVATAWAVLAALGRFRVGRDWRDRAGVVLGAAWLAWVVIDRWAQADLVLNPPSGWVVTPVGIIDP